MTVIELNAQSWHTCRDFYGALLTALGAHKGHGLNINAFVDSMIWGGMNAVEPPYEIRISGAENLSKDIREEIGILKQALAEARAERQASRGRDVEITLEITP